MNISFSRDALNSHLNYIELHRMHKMAKNYIRGKKIAIWNLPNVTLPLMKTTLCFFRITLLNEKKKKKIYQPYVKRKISREKTNPPTLKLIDTIAKI
jgi:hypothetical protein